MATGLRHSAVVLAAVAALVFLVSSCIPYLSTERVPAVQHSGKDIEPAGQYLALVVWRDGVYRWSEGGTSKPHFLANPFVVAGRDLNKLPKLAASRTNFGVVAWDGHGGTRYGSKHPLLLYLIAENGAVRLFRFRKDSSTDWNAEWHAEASAKLSEAWHSSLLDLEKCRNLRREADTCALEGSLFISGLGSTAELRRAFSARDARVIREFLGENPQVDQLERAGAWEFGGDESAI